MRSGRHDEALVLLAPEPPLALATSDVAVRRKLTQCGAFSFLGRFAEASQALTAAQQLIAEHHPELAGEAALRQGTLAFRQGDLKQAQRSFNSALDIARQQGNSFLEIAGLGSLGLTAIRLERYDESLDLNKRALELAKAAGDFDSIARIEGNMGWAYRVLGDLKNALDYDNAAAAQSLANGSIGRGITWLSAAGDVFYDLRDYTSAESKSIEALRLADSLHDTDDAIYCLQNLARIALARHHYDSAGRNIEDALGREGATPIHDRQLDSRLIAAQLAAATHQFAVAESAYSLIVLDRVASAAIKWEALASLAQLHALRGKTALAEREFRQSILTISKAEDSIQDDEARLAFLSVAIRFYDQYINLLVALKRPIDALKIADLSRAHTLEHGLSLNSSAIVTNGSAASREFGSAPQDIAVRQNAILLFYWLGEERSYLWAITPAGISMFRLPAGPEIDALALTYRESFFGPRDPLDSTDSPGQKLFDILVRPAQKLIPLNSSVVILPDSKLNGLNFETLLVNQPQTHYWIEDVTLSVANSLALLARSSRVPPPKSPELLLFGEPLPATKEFPSLADARQEIEALKKHFPENRRRLFTGGQAIASNYLSSNPARYSFVHFATHGIASTSRPLESAIVLSPEGDRYKLYARDIMRQPLNAFMVSISACNGVGERQLAGEGLVGLSWAFLRAGAHNVVAGLWEVSTASAPQIMDGLYRGVTAGQDPATALRNAKLNLLHSKGPYRRPFYWAPFQIYSGS